MVNKIYNLKFIIIIFLSLILVLLDSSKLGFFADDISLIYYLNQGPSISQLIKSLETFDAGRYFQIFNVYLFLKLSNLFGLETIHFFQIVIYFINSIILINILNILDIKKSIIVLSWIFIIFFNLNSEVVFWTHNLGMTLLASTSFLLFLSLNLKLSNNLHINKNIYYELLILLLSIYSILTYEQYIYGFYFIILIRSVVLFKSNKKIYSFLLFFLYSILIVTFSLYKVFMMKGLNLDINLIPKNILLNIFYSIVIPIKSIISPASIDSFNIRNVLLFSLINFLIFRHLFKSQIKNKNDYLASKSKETLLKIIFFILLYFFTIFPLFFHYLSPRHFYLPSFLLIISVGLIFMFINQKRLIKQKNLKKYVLILFFIILTNNFIKFDSYKYQQINNYELKINFYKEINEKFSYAKNINLINFPNSLSNVTFFAHEQGDALKFLFGSNSPIISKDQPMELHKVSIKFKKVLNKKIIYELTN